MSATTHTLHAWQAAGSPKPPYNLEACDAVCATCAAAITVGVPLSQIETPTMSNHADYFRFRFGGKYVCQACAWMFSAGKGRPGNFIATPGRMEYTVISPSTAEGKRPWIDVLADIASMPPETPVAGVMTTDVKPRLWPRVRLATVSRFGLYIHAGEYDISEWREFGLLACLDLIGEMIAPLKAGYAKASLYHGLFRDYARSSRDPALAMEWEAKLSQHRGKPHFLPALIAAGVRKESKRDVKPAARPAIDTQPVAAGGHQFDPSMPGLF